MACSRWPASATRVMPIELPRAAGLAHGGELAGPVLELRRTVEQVPRPLLRDADEDGVEPFRIQRSLHGAGRDDAHLVLGGAPAEQDRDAPAPAHAFSRACAKSSTTSS